MCPVKLHFRSCVILKYFATIKCLIYELKYLRFTVWFSDHSTSVRDCDFQAPFSIARPSEVKVTRSEVKVTQPVAAAATVGSSESES